MGLSEGREGAVRLVVVVVVVVVVILIRMVERTRVRERGWIRRSHGVGIRVRKKIEMRVVEIT